MVDLPDLEQREGTLAILRRTNQARDGVAGSQCKAADLARADVDVVGTGELRAIGRAQEARNRDRAAVDGPEEYGAV